MEEKQGWGNKMNCEFCGNKLQALNPPIIVKDILGE
mgnify:CR=1 FL=1